MPQDESPLAVPPTPEDAQRLLVLFFALQTGTDAALAHQSLEAVLQRVLEQVRAALGADSAVVVLPTDEGDALVARAAVGLDDQTAQQWRVPWGRGIAGRIAQTRAPLIVDDMQTTEIEVVRPYLRTHVRSLLGVPLLAGTRLVGVLHVATIQPRRFTRNDVLLLQFAADRLARTIAHAQLDAAEQQARGQAEEAVRLRDQVLALASHDLRAPLTAIAGRATLIEQRLERGQAVEPAWLHEQVTHVNRAITRMVRTIDDLLDVARLQMGESLPLERADVELEALVEEVVAEYGTPQRPAALVVERPAEEVRVQGDRSRLARVLHNLIGNALKYSPRQTPVVVRLAREGATARLEVRDQGVGIPAAEIPQVFTRFFRAATAAGISGTGLGLAGSKALVEQHGGTITLQSTEGAGTTVTVRLPLAPPRGPLPAE